MNRLSLPSWASLLGRLLLAGVLAAAAVSKITDPAGTVRAVRAYRILPDSVAVPFGHALPWVELGVAVLLFAGLAVRVAGAMAGGLLAAFVVGIASAAARGLRIDCGCFGGGGVTAHPHYTGELIRDGLLLAVAVAVAAIPDSRLSMDSRSAAVRPRAAVARPAVARFSVARSTVARSGVARSSVARSSVARSDVARSDVARSDVARSDVARSSVVPAAAGPSPAAGRQRKVAAHRLAAQRDRARRRLRLNSGIAAALVLTMALIGIGVGHSADTAGSLVVPTAATAAGGIVVGDASAVHHVIAYEDPQCPVCGEFEKANGAILQLAVAEGKAVVEYRMMSFLGPESVRAVAALGAAAQEGRFEQLRETLYAHQPREGTGGFTVADLIRLGAAVGLTDAAYVGAVTRQTYAPWARTVETAAERAGVTGTPTVVIDGRQQDLTSVLLTPGALAPVLGVSVASGQVGSGGSPSPPPSPGSSDR